MPASAFPSTSTSSFPCYFTCTLGHAQILNDTLDPAPYATISQFIDYLAHKFSDVIAVACASPGVGDTWIVEALTFAEVRELAEILAGQLREQLGPNQGKQTVALYASSSLTYLVYLLACLWSGSRVALISTACSSDAVRHLLKDCEATAILSDKKHEELVNQALLQGSEDVSVSPARITLEHQSIQQLKRLKKAAHPISPAATASSEDIIIYGHSSGTSTGRPKPIPITHQNEIGALPRFHQVADHASPDGTFSTTPIYTGGLADLWRSWSAATTLWTWPEHQAPITAENLLNYRNAAESWIDHRSVSISPIRYISCVPYVTQMMAEDKRLMKWLQSMEMVGVGGAAMPLSLGDLLVDNGINLVSRFGSRECGFLLSSDRNFNRDKDWQYIRHDPSISSIGFQKWDETNSELILAETWPSLSPAIRGKLPYNSHDIFVPHENIPNAWRYNGRSDVQITLRTGKKFDPAGIESALTLSEWIKDVVVVGNDRIVPAGVIFCSPKADSLEKEAREEEIWQAVSNMNAKCMAHARLKRNMIAIRSHRESAKILKSSKGTIMRGRFDETFQDIIRTLYDETDKCSSEPKLDMLDDRQRTSAILSMIKEHIDIQDSETEISFYEAGIDSTMSMQIRRQLQTRLPKELGDSLPLNLVYDTGSIRGLSKYIGDLRQTHMTGQAIESDSQDRAKEIQEFLNHVRASYVKIEQSLDATLQTIETIKRCETGEAVVLLTGGTGFLGAHVLAELAIDDRVQEIICLVRESSTNKTCSRSRDRIEKALSSYSLSLSDECWSKVQCFYSTLHEPNLGLNLTDLHHILDRTTQIIHSAWAVNFSLSLEAYGTQLRGLLNLHKIAKIASDRGNQVRLIFVSSTAAILSAPQPIDEDLSTNPQDASSSGYGKSKWVAERLLQDLGNSLDIKIVRVGQLTASQKTGAWNLQEAWPLMLDAGFHLLGNNGKAILPDLSKIAGKELDWLPVDLAAKSLKDIVVECPASAARDQPGVLHVLSNVDSNPTWAEVNGWLSKEITVQRTGEPQSFEIELVPPAEWLDRLVSKSHNGEKHLAMSLVPLWRKGWEELQGPASSIQFSTKLAQQASKTMELVAQGRKVITRETFLQMLQWMLSQH